MCVGEGGGGGGGVSIFANDRSDSHGRLKVYARLGVLRRADAADFPSLDAWRRDAEDRTAALHEHL